LNPGTCRDFLYSRYRLHWSILQFLKSGFVFIAAHCLAGLEEWFILPLYANRRSKEIVS